MSSWMWCRSCGSGGQDRHGGDAGGAVQVGVSHPRVAGNLPRAGGAAELEHDLVDLPEPRGADGLTVAEQSAVGVDGKPPTGLSRPLRDEAFLLAVLAQPVIG